MKRILLLPVLLFSMACLGQVKQKEQDEILAEAWLMYNSERASWLGSDIFQGTMPDKMKQAGGYFSYTREDKKHTCIFFDRSETPKTLAAFTFDDSFTTEAVEVDTLQRAFSSYESDIYDILYKAKARVQGDTIFKHYKNTNYNYIPLITGNKKKVYILTGPSVTGVVVMGNDYLIEFDKKNRITSAKPLHKNIIPIDYAQDGQDDVISMHNHQESTGDLITATDICTLLLYAPYARWQQHYVISDRYVSLWDCEKEKLVVLTRKAWERMMGDGDVKDNKEGKD